MRGRDQAPSALEATAISCALVARGGSMRVARRTVQVRVARIISAIRVAVTALVLATRVQSMGIVASHDLIQFGVG